MKSVPFFTKLKRCWSSRPVTQIRNGLRCFVSLHWWVERSWKMKVQFLIGLTAVLLLGLSLAAWYVFQEEHSKISNSFLRLQLFGPQEIFVQPPGSPQNETEPNFCPFYLEVRQPYGPALPNVRIEASFQTYEDSPFWFLADETKQDGRFQFAVPNMQMPERVKLNICVKDGPKNSEFTAFLKARVLHEKSQNDSSESIPETTFSMEDSPLESISVPKHDFTSQFRPSLGIPDRILETPEFLLSVFTPEEQIHPVFVAAWQNGKLLACRPVLARKQSRNVTLTLPESVFGMVSVLLIDSSVSPPRVVQHELVYRLPPQNPEKKDSQLAFLRSFVEKLNSPEFRAEKQALEFLPGELVEIEEGTPSENPELLAVANRLLGSAIAPKVTVQAGLELPELSPFKYILAQMDQLSTEISLPPVDSNGVPETVHSFMEQALKIQGLFLRQNLTSPVVQAQYLPSLPVVFDSQSAQEENYRKAVENFKTNIKNRLESLVCLILCSALCLVVMMLMMTILGLPTDWRNWILALGVVLLALCLAKVIASQSDVESDRENVHYAIFEGKEEF